MATRRSFSPLLVLGLACCGGDPVRFPDPPVVDPRFSALVPLRAMHLAGPDESPWVDYDPARGGDTRRALGRLKGLGARQVVIEAPYAWTTAPFDRAYEGVAAGNVLYALDTARPAEEQFGSCQSGDFSLRPYRPPLSFITNPRGAVLLPATDVSAMQRLSGPFRQPSVPTRLVALLELPDAEALVSPVEVTGISDGGIEATEVLSVEDPQRPKAPRVGARIFRSISSVTYRGTGPARLTLFTHSPEDQAMVWLRSALGLAREAGLQTILYLRNAAMPAAVTECRRCARTGDCFLEGAPSSTCVFDRPEDTTDGGLCHVQPGSASFFDPSSDRSAGFSDFFAAYGRHVEQMTRLAVDSGVALLVLGGGSPYLSGAGASVFADNSQMDDRRAQLIAGWRDGVIKAAKAVRGDARLLLSYAAQGAFIEGPLRRQPARPEWALVDFWEDLDVVSIDLVLPGRPGFLDTPDTAPREARELLQHMATQGLATQQVYGNLAEIGEFARARGHTLRARPVLLLSDRAPAMPGGAAQALPGSPLPRLGTPADFVEQARFVEARLLLVGAAAQQGSVGGVALSLAPGGVALTDGQEVPSYGGRRKAGLPPGGGRPGGFDLRSDYFGLFDTEAEKVIRKFWCPGLAGCLSSN